MLSDFFKWGTFEGTPFLSACICFTWCQVRQKFSHWLQYRPIVCYFMSHFPFFRWCCDEPTMHQCPTYCYFMSNPIFSERCCDATSTHLRPTLCYFTLSPTPFFRWCCDDLTTHPMPLVYTFTYFIYCSQWTSNSIC